MRFIKLGASIVLLAWLGACGVLPQTESEPAISTSVDSDVQQPVDAASAEPVAPARGPQTNNPYLQSTISVPATAQRLFQQAILAQKAKNYTKAEVLLQELTASYPQLSGPFLNLGLLYMATDKPEQAQEAFTHAIQANATNLAAYNQLGILARQQGQFERAEDYYLKALAVWPEHAQSHRNLGILYELYMGKLEPALSHYEQYQALLPEDDPQVLGWIADLKRRIASETAKAN